MDTNLLSEVLMQRIVWTVIIIALGIGAYWLVNRFLLQHASRKSLGSELFRVGVPALLYFTTPSCVPCRTIQRPAIQRLRDMRGDHLQVVEIDASTQPETASRWGVLSVPTTFVIDSFGRPRYVNHGVTPLEKLMKQFDEINQLKSGE